jgi:hypothetical protein
MKTKVASVERIRNEFHKPAPYTPRTTSGDTNTKYSETPRTLHGNAAAFKGARYGNWIEHYSAPNKHGWVLWVLTFVMLVGTAVIVVAVKT